MEISIPTPFRSLADVKELAPDLVAAAQALYDDWHQVEGLDEELGAGGICHLIAEQFGNILAGAGVEELATIHATIGENHVYVVALLEDGVFSIDIPPHIYESGGGYVWTKKPGVVFAPSDIVLFKIEGPMVPEDFNERYCD